MNGINAIKNRLSNENRSVEETLVTNISIVMREFHLSYEEMMNLPFPTFIIMLRILEKEAKRAEKGQKRGMQKHK